MIEELRRVIAQVEQQPEDVQRHIAEVVQQELEHACHGQASAAARTSYAGAWSHLPEDDELETLDRLRHGAETVRLELEEREWDEVVGSPQGQDVLDRLATEAREEIARGDVEEGGWE